jgi:hypothetical protein
MKRDSLYRIRIEIGGADGGKDPRRARAELVARSSSERGRRRSEAREER